MKIEDLVKLHFPVVNDTNIAVAKAIVEAAVSGQLEVPDGTYSGYNDIKGNRMCVGDVCGHDYQDSEDQFKVVYQDRAFRKAYFSWSDKSIPYPPLNNVPMEVGRYVVQKPFRK